MLKYPLFFASFLFCMSLVFCTANAFNRSYYLPTLRPDHPCAKRAIKFLEKQQIFELAQLKSRLRSMSAHDISSWHDLANAYRHLPNESQARALAWDISQKILRKKGLKPRDR
jgi:hypothetical protein